LFGPTDTAATPAQTPIAEYRLKLSKEVEPIAQDEATQVRPIKTDTTDVKTPAVSRYSKAAGKSPSQLAKAESKSANQEDKQELETWQQYLRYEFSNATLSQAVSEVMQQHSGQVLEIAAIVDAIFVNEIPHRCEARRESMSQMFSQLA